MRNKGISTLTLTILCMAFLSHAATIDYSDVHNLHVVRGRTEVKGSAKYFPGNKEWRCLYDFTNCPNNNNSYIRFDVNQKLPGKPSAIIWNVKILSETEDVDLALWFRDRNGEIYLSRKTVHSIGNKQAVKFMLPTRPSWASGDENSVMDLPMVLMGLAVNRTSDGQHGKLLIGGWKVETDLTQGNPFAMHINIPNYFWGKSDIPATSLVLNNYANRNLSQVYALVKIMDRYKNKVVLSKKIIYRNVSTNLTEIRSKVTLNLPFGSYTLTATLFDDKQELARSEKNFQHFMGDCSKMKKTILDYEAHWSPLGGVWGFMTPEFGNKFGARWCRFEGPCWSNTEKSKDKFDASEIADAAKEYHDNYVRPIVLQTLYAYPKFRTSRDIADFSTGYGMNLKYEAKALKGFTKYFELGNEDNGERKFIYTEIARNGAAGIRSVQPFAVIANSGTAFIDFGWLSMQMKRGLFHYLDALCVHPYTNNSTPSQDVSAEKSMVLQKLRNLNKLVDQAGGMKEMWNTEFGWPNSTPEGEKDRAELYVREMVVNDAANMQTHGAYTFKRDYGTVDFPAGPAINAYANMRAGHRFAGLIVDGGTWTAVYEKNGRPFAIVWTPDATPQSGVPDGDEYLDIFGNPIERKNVQITQSPVYVKGVDRKILEQAVKKQCELQKQLFLNCLSIYPSALFAKNLRDIDSLDCKTLQEVLLRWSQVKKPVTVADKAVISRILNWYLVADRLKVAKKNVTDMEIEKLDQEKLLLRKVVIANNRKDLDLAGLRYLLNKWDRISAERQLAMQSGASDYAATCFEQEQVVHAIAKRFGEYEEPFQFAVFANLYQKKPEGYVEKLVFIPGENATLFVRISSYSGNKQTATVTLVLPKEWECEQQSVKMEVGSDSVKFVKYVVKCPINVKDDQPSIKVITSIAGKPDVVARFDNIEIVPPVRLDIMPINRDISQYPVKIEIHNLDDKKVSGKVSFSVPGLSGKSQADLRFSGLSPSGKVTLPLDLKNVSADVQKKWVLIADVALDDGRRFDLTVKLDFTLATLAPTKISIDADLSEWKNALPLKLDKDEYTGGSYGAAWSPEDCSATSYLMWDKQYLYFAAVVRDQTFNQLFERDAMWKQDSIQLVFAADRNGKVRELTLALSPAGPKIWDSALHDYLTDASFAVKYKNAKIIYEVSIPWASFNKRFNKDSFLYGIAVNDDDAITGRRYLERFHGSIVHGKDVSTFAKVRLMKSGKRFTLKQRNLNEIFFDDFDNDVPGLHPSAWHFHCNYLPQNSIAVVKEKGIDGSNALRLHNSVGYKLNHFSIVYVPLKNLSPEATYVLSFQVKGEIADNRRLIGIASDKWGNESFSYASWKPAIEWQQVQMRFNAPISGKINLIIRNMAATENLLIDNVRVENRVGYL